MQDVRLRPALESDLLTIQEIERAAGEQYREYGLDIVADDEPETVEVLAEYTEDGRAWVAVDSSNRPLGYILVDVIDGCGHIEQVSVVPRHQGEGVGRAFIEEVREWAISSGLTALTLTTYKHIPWNMPLYEHLGFRSLPLNEISRGVRAVRASEAEHGLDPDLRVVMRLDL